MSSQSGLRDGKICVARVYCLFSWAGKRSADLHHLDETKVAHLRLEPECARGETSVPATDHVSQQRAESSCEELTERRRLMNDDIDCHDGDTAIREINSKLLYPLDAAASLRNLLTNLIAI